MERSRSIWLLCALVLGACAADPASDTAVEALTAEQLHDPQTCKPCHQQHYREWQSSMHAYAAQDPVFIAMNERGQLETGGELGEFCVRCHAPLAVELGLTRDGLNLPDLQHPSTRGVTCYVCHSASAVLEDHNQHLQLTHDGVMRGGLGSADAATAEPNRAPPRPNRAHHSAYSGLHDGGQLQSAGLCGSCHDVVNGHGVEVERTFAEWRQTRYAQPGPEQQTCGSCHMPRYTGRATADAPERQLHRHMFAGVDVALEKDFPGVAAQKAAIECAFGDAIELQLRTAPGGTPGQSIEVTLTNRGAGHSFPSGAAQDRRAWIELIAYDAAGAVLYQSGVFAEGEIVLADASLEVLRDELHDASGDPVHMFWQAAPSKDHPLGYSSNLIPAGESRSQRYELPRPAARVTARLQLRAMGLEILDEFQGITLPLTQRVIDTGYLDDGPIRSRFRTLTVPGSQRELRVDERQTEGLPVGDTPTDCTDQGYVELL